MHTHTLLTEYVYIPGERPYFVPEGTTATVRFELTNPPAPEDGFEFEFTVFLSTQDGDALGELKYYIHGYCMWHCYIS